MFREGIEFVTARNGQARNQVCGPLGFAVALLFLILTRHDALAADNDTLVSVSIPAGAVVNPRTIFTQTWTLQNTGTTTWTPGASGYTLNLISKDSLGAVQVYPTTVSTRYVLSAIIGSGKSVPPGGQAAFTMSFIAPEMAGTYTDTFQLNSASSVYFGPTVAVQITVPKAGSTNQYDRALAVSYANNYAGYICSDGYFWTNGSGYAYFGAGAKVPTAYLGDDCAHFVSSCIGTSPTERGAGLSIPSRVPPTYGEPGAARLIDDCLIAPGYATEVFSLTNLSPGDLIGWNWEGDTNINDIDHVTLYLGNGLTASHAVSAVDVSATTFFQSSEPKWKWHLIHIYDAPTLTTFVAKNKMVLSWGTNWFGYGLYSTTNLAANAGWTKVAASPMVSGVLNRLTNNLAPGAVFYRLMHP